MVAYLIYLKKILFIFFLIILEFRNGNSLSYSTSYHITQDELIYDVIKIPKYSNKVVLQFVVDSDSLFNPKVFIEYDKFPSLKSAKNIYIIDKVLTIINENPIGTYLFFGISGDKNVNSLRYFSGNAISTFLSISVTIESCDNPLFRGKSCSFVPAISSSSSIIPTNFQMNLNEIQLFTYYVPLFTHGFIFKININDISLDNICTSTQFSSMNIEILCYLEQSDTINDSNNFSKIILFNLRNDLCNKSIKSINLVDELLVMKFPTNGNWIFELKFNFFDNFNKIVILSNNSNQIVTGSIYNKQLLCSNGYFDSNFASLSNNNIKFDNNFQLNCSQIIHSMNSTYLYSIYSLYSSNSIIMNQYLPIQLIGSLNSMPATAHGSTIQIQLRLQPNNITLFLNSLLIWKSKMNKNLNININSNQKLISLNDITTNDYIQFISFYFNYICVMRFDGFAYLSTKINNNFDNNNFIELITSEAQIKVSNIPKNNEYSLIDSNDNNDKNESNKNIINNKKLKIIFIWKLLNPLLLGYNNNNENNQQISINIQSIQPTSTSSMSNEINLLNEEKYEMSLRISFFRCLEDSCHNHGICNELQKNDIVYPICKCYYPYAGEFCTDLIISLPEYWNHVSYFI